MRPISWGGWSPQNYGRSYAGRMTLMTALAKSINTVPVRLAKDQARHQAVIADMAKAMGVDHAAPHATRPCRSAPRVTVLDQATGYAVLPGRTACSRRRHGISQILNYDGVASSTTSASDEPRRNRKCLSEQAVRR
jgi:penicillin-binding protein 1A